MSNLSYQVILIIENEQETISTELDLLNETMSGKEWILQAVLNGSEDNSVVELAKFAQGRNSGKNVHIWEHDHHEDVGELKEKVVKEIIHRSGRYPIVVFWNDLSENSYDSLRNVG